MFSRSHKEWQESHLHGVQFPQGMKLSNFSLTFPDYNKILMCVQDCLGGLGGMLSQKIFKIRMLRLAENQFHITKFPDFSCFSKIPSTITTFILLEDLN